MEMKNLTVGIDLGGTKILAVVVAGNGKIVSRAKTKTIVGLGMSETGIQMKETAEEALEKFSASWGDIGSVGIAVPTPVDPETGEALHSPALGWKNRPLKKTLEKIFKRELFLQNDVNCGTLAEFYSGAAKGHRNVVGYFVGTGLGGGIIVNGKLYVGKKGSAGELGHEVIRFNGRKCGCGKKGCLEAYCSKTAFCKQFHKLINEDGKESILAELTDCEFKNIKSVVLAKAFRARDKVTCKVMKKGFYLLGLAAANMASVLAPDCIVFGGGVVEALQDEIMPYIRKGFQENLFALSEKDILLKISSLGDDAVPLGAAIFSQYKGNV